MSWTTSSIPRAQTTFSTCPEASCTSLAVRLSDSASYDVEPALRGASDRQRSPRELRPPNLIRSGSGGIQNGGLPSLHSQAGLRRGGYARNNPPAPLHPQVRLAD